jgi:hypothetical protein
VSNDNELTVKIGGDPTGLDATLKHLDEQTEAFNKRLNALAAAAAEAFAAFEIINKPLEAYAELEKSVNQVTQSLKNQGIYSKETLEDYEEQADAISKLTAVRESSIIQGQAIFQNLAGQMTITEELTKAVVDFAAANRMDVASAFEMVGRSAYGSTMMLKRHGVEINESLSAHERMAQFIKLSSEQFDGQAEAATKGVGALEQAKVAFERLEEAIGKRFAPAAESAGKFMASLFDSLSKNDTFLTVAQIALEAASAFMAYSAAVRIATVVTALMEAAVEGLIGSTGIGLLVVAAVEVWQHWNTIWPALQSVFHSFVNDVGPAALALGKIVLGMATFNPDLVRSGWNEFSTIVKKGFDDAVNAAKHGNQDLMAEDMKALDELLAMENDHGKKAQAERDAKEQRRLAAAAAQRAVLVAEANNESKALIDIKKQEAEVLAKIEDDKYAKVRKQLQQHLADLRALEASEQRLSDNQRTKFNGDVLQKNKNFQKMDMAQQNTFILQKGTQLQGQIDDEQSAQIKAAEAEAQLHIQSDNQYLQDQIKFGTAYAAINQAMHSEIYQGTKQAFSEMADMQNSHNSTLKAIGKVAAEANIVMKTAESAMNIYAGFSTIPIVGPTLGLAAAAAAIAYGAEQFQKVAAANEGGIIPGFGPDKDSTLSFLTPGELVVPRKNFDETVNAVADARSGGASGSLGDSSDVVGLLKSIDSKVSNPPQVVLEPQGGNDDPFWDYAIRRISARVEYGNARLITKPAGA